MNNREFGEQTLLVNNADSASGRSVLRYFAQSGASVVALAADVTQLAGLVEQYSNIVVLQADNEGALPEALANANVSVLINAASDIDCSKLANLGAGDIAASIQSELTATLTLTQAVLKAFERNAYGRVVNIVPSAAVFGARDSALNAAAAAGLIGFSRAAALDYAASDIRINTVAALLPGVPWREPGLESLTDKAVLFELERFVAAIAYLADARCTLNGKVWTATGARVAQCFTSTVPGHYLQSNDASEVAQNIAAITDTNYAMIPQDHSDELLLIDV